METKEIVASLISTGITAVGILIIWLLKIIITKTTNKNKQNKTDLDITKLVDYILEAEIKLGSGQGKAKLLYVLNKLGKKETDKKAVAKINETHKIIETAANTNKEV